MINQAIQINCFKNHLLCPMQCYLNSVYNSEVHKILADSLSVTTHAIQLLDLTDAAHPLIILLESHVATSYFDIPNIHLTAEKTIGFINRRIFRT